MAPNATLIDSRNKQYTPRSDIAHVRGWGDLITSLKGGLTAFGVGRVIQKGTEELYSREYAHTVITVDPTSFAAMAGRLEAYKNLPYKSRPMLQAIGEYVVSEVVPRMFREGDGGKWPQLSDTTNEFRERMGYGGAHPMLINTTALYDAATSNQAIVEVKTGANARVVLGGDKFAGSLRDKFFVHMSGSDAGWGSIPPRPFMPESPEDLTASEQAHIHAIMRRHIEDIERKASKGWMKGYA